MRFGALVSIVRVNYRLRDWGVASALLGLPDSDHLLPPRDAVPVPEDHCRYAS